VRSVLSTLLWFAYHACSAVSVQRQHCAVASALQLVCVSGQLSVMRCVGNVRPVLHAALLAARQFCAVLSFGRNGVVPIGPCCFVVLQCTPAMAWLQVSRYEVWLEGEVVPMCGTHLCCAATCDRSPL
jgi:hypothetical protein